MIKSRPMDRQGKLERFAHSLSGWVEKIAIVGILGMVLFTLIDVVGAIFFRWPLPGVTELVPALQVIAIAGAMAFVQIERRNIQITIIADMLPKRVRAFLVSLVALLSLVLFMLLGWQSYEYGQLLRSMGEFTDTLKIPKYLLLLWIALSCIPMCLVLLVELLGSLAKGVKK